jgi:hypothetical protein
MRGDMMVVMRVAVAIRFRWWLCEGYVGLLWFGGVVVD